MGCFYECFGFCYGRFERVFFFNSCFCCSCFVRVFSSFCCCLFLSSYCRLIVFKKKRFIALFFVFIIYYGISMACLAFAYLPFCISSYYCQGRFALVEPLTIVLTYANVLFERKERLRTLRRS